ncbi:MAG: SDR family oxidoreductase [Hyphomicrobiaceae bacterium]
MQIRGDLVLITGGCGDIGLATARQFLTAGKRVILVDRRIEPGERLATEHPGRVDTIACDLSRADEIERCLGPVFGGEAAPDILVNNVGISPKFDADGTRLKAWTITVDQWDHLFATNVRSYFHCTRMALPPMIARGHGRIINVASIAARGAAYQAVAHYVASKSAILGLTMAVAKEVTPLGITVNAINPGRILTSMTRDVSDEVNAAIIDRIPARRLGQPDDIAKVALFLASDLADYLTGTAIEVNGGLYMGP